MRVCVCVTATLGLGSLTLFTGSDDDTLLDDHYDAMGCDPKFIR